MAVRKDGLSREDLGYVEHGSDAHRALLGVDREKDPEAKAKLEEALNATPPKVVSKTKPINRENYKARTRRREGDVIIDGWRRLGR